jgi:hypothetical protein
MKYDEGSSSTEEPLPGAFSTLTKVGNTVRRSTGPWTPAVHALLRHLERVGFEGAPRVLGVDPQGREVLTYILGEVPRTARPDFFATDRALVEVGLLLRRYHEAVSDFSLPAGVGWYEKSDLGAGSVVCYNDLAPRNTVFRGGSPVAFLDFDLASLAPPAWDVAHLAWQFVPLADAEGCARQGWSSPPDRPGRLRLVCDGYGLSEREQIGFPELLSGASKRPLRASSRWRLKACRPPADGPRRAYPRSFAPTEIGSRGTARPCGTPSVGL